MALPSQLEIVASWMALWDPNGPYHLPTAFQKNTRVGFSWFRRPEPIPLPDTGPLVVLNSSAYGIVTVNLKNAAVSDMRTVSPVSLRAVDYDEGTGKLSVELGFGALKLAGDYEVRRGRATGDAVKIASQSFKNHPLFAATALDPDPNLTLAKSYQAQLAQTTNGQSMLNTYYTHNDAYANAFSNTVFLRFWQKLPTGGKTTSDWANLTANAAQPENTSTVIVNSSDGVNYDDNYQLHAYAMQGSLVVACNAQNNNDAADAASNFQTATLPHATSPQTVQDVFNVVSTGTPPSQQDLDTFVEPEFLAAIRTKNKPIHDAIEREEEDVRRGVIIREETIRPIHSGFRSYVGAPSLKLVGTVSEDAHGRPQVQFNAIQGSVQPVELALGVFPGDLHPELAAAVAKVSFLKSVLALQVNKALATSQLRNYVGRMMSQALNADSSPLRQ